MKKLAAVLLLALASCKSPAPKTEPPPDHQGPPKPGPHHLSMKRLEGTWDATSKMYMAAGQPPAESKGVEVNAVGCGGLWMTSDFKGEMEGQAFEGRAIYGYDEAKKKHVGVWVDNHVTTLMFHEGTCEGNCDTVTMWADGPEIQGKMTKWKLVTKVKDASTVTFDMYTVADGEETLVMAVVYRKRK